MADTVKNIEIRQYDGSSYDSVLYPKTTASNVTYEGSTVHAQLSANTSNIATNTSNISTLTSERLVKPSSSGILTYGGSGTNTDTVSSISTSTGIVSGATGLVTGNAVYQANLHQDTNIRSITYGGTGASTGTDALKNFINALTASTTIDSAADYLPFFDTSDATVKKMLISTLSSGSAKI